MHRPKISSMLIYALALWLSTMSPGQADEAPLQLEFLHKLIETSSAAAEVEASDNEAAKRLREEARSLYESAVQQESEGLIREAMESSTLAKRKMFEAVRELDLDQSIVEKKADDYSNRLESIRALMQAYERIVSEKGLSMGQSDAVRNMVQEKVDAADEQRRSGNTRKAKELLDQAYREATTAIEHLRSGDTLVRDLNFKSKEEEYAYEVDRNDTHRMLVNVLLEEKMRDNPQTKGLVKKFMDQASAIRSDAEKAADAGDFDRAVKIMEESTREIVRAIRSAGVYIPG